MKSLEILEHIKNAPSFMGGDDRYKNNIQSHWVFLEDIETIKADLEVLEILKKKYVDVQVFYADIKSSYPHEEQIRQYNQYQSRRCLLTKEEFDKVKQWLEENEDE